MSRVYGVYKLVSCDLLNGECGDTTRENDYTPPNCKECSLYNDWKKSGLTIEEFIDSITDEIL